MSVIYTVGHSTRSIEEFIALLQANRIEIVVDVRRIARSRRNPQFGGSALCESLEERGILYKHIEGLGGLRHASGSSLNTAWRNLSFRGYADYMQTPEFSESIHELVEIGREKRTAIMCAEAVPWRCHRSLISDALVVRGFHVVDIINAKENRPHNLTPFARVDGESITYPQDHLTG